MKLNHHKFLVDSIEGYDYSKSSMTENRDLIYKIVEVLEPKRVLELGTYYGCSYFAFAQAILDLGLDTELTGVDAWFGDIHTGFYGNEVLDHFLKIKSDLFPDDRFKHIRKMFNDAVDDFEDGSLDIILIDGTHTYEDVKEDFENYLPKLAKNGIMLFHDTNVPRFSMGAFWQELEARYPAYNVLNEYGFGVLAPKGTGNLDKISRYIDEKVVVYTAISKNKDNVIEQPKQSVSADYILITDDESINGIYKGWKVQKMEEISDEPVINAKKPKIVPYNVDGMGNYHLAIWADGLVHFNSTFVEHMIDAIEDYPLAVIKHPDRDCVYDEYDACVELGRFKSEEDKQKGLEQVIRYKKDKLYPHRGLYACTVLVWNLKHPDASKISDAWWNEIINGSSRDQISLPYVLKKLDIEPKVIDINLWDNTLFKCGKHNYE